MSSLGLRPRDDIDVNLGTTYLNVPLATVHHLYIVIHTAVADTPVHPRQAREIRARLVLALTNKSVEGWMRNKIKQ